MVCSLETTVARRLKIARELRRYTQAEAGELLDCSGSKVGRVEKNKAPIRLEYIEDSARIYRVPTFWILGQGPEDKYQETAPLPADVSGQILFNGGTVE